MSEPRQTSSRWIILAAALALAGGVAIVRAANPSGGKPAAAPAAAAATPAKSRDADVKRYQVPVTATQPSKGPADALVTVVEWCDLLSPDCAKVDTVVDQVDKQYGDRVRWVFRNFSQPATHSQLAHEFARIALEQADKFWQAKTLIEQAGGTPTRDDFERYSKQLGLDWSRVGKALDDHTYAPHVVADRLFAEMFEVRDVPAFFVNGRRLSGEPTAAGFKTLIDDEMARAQKLVAGGVTKDHVYAELTKNGVFNKLPARPN